MDSRSATAPWPAFRTLFATAVALMPLSPAHAGSDDLCFRGVNLSGAEYGEVDGIEGTHFLYPTEKTKTYFAEKGFDTVRLPFKWERLQPRLGERFDSAEMERLRNAVDGLRAKGFTVVLDPHNFGYYGPDRVTSEKVSTRQFANFWTRLAVEFANEDHVVFGLMNEPYDISATNWLKAVNGAITGIRAAKARNLILVPGTHWSGVRSWQVDFGSGSNAEVMLGVKDSLDRYAFEVHTYFDEDSSGTHAECTKATEVAASFDKMTTWLRQHGQKAFLGEFGGSHQPACLEAIASTVRTLGDNSDVWLGWTYWAGGDWWSPTENMNIQPTEAGDKPQLLSLLSEMGTSSKAPGACSMQ
ncbi:glycoside hydrolase family 5 protein [Rhizobium sp. KVB221]|uniref:Glycoside hydrolase family 5 protein n=1 Tax=Rhizobium setariae TaxID=2801340 RepID=A0A936YVC0_9HYPH|nr:glycoside hydrolase family 5 protein [Rhizobium setariae]MBL0373515.1 glycoside hydrolase family 5 protein [Rhizobium setariae]